MELEEEAVLIVATDVGSISVSVVALLGRDNMTPPPRGPVRCCCDAVIGVCVRADTRGGNDDVEGVDVDIASELESLLLCPDIVRFCGVGAAESTSARTALWATGDGAGVVFVAPFEFSGAVMFSPIAKFDDLD